MFAKPPRRSAERRGVIDEAPETVFVAPVAPSCPSERPSARSLRLAVRRRRPA